MSKFPLAYYEKHDNTVDTDDVRDIFTETGKSPELHCADERCRLENPQTRISAVCCDPRKQCTVPAYFRTYPGHKHSESCIYAAFGEDVEYILSHKNDFKYSCDNLNITKELGNIDTAVLPDEFSTEYSPRDFMADIEKETQRQLKKVTSRVTARRLARCRTPQKTNRLSNVVDMALKLEKIKMRKSAVLSLPDRKDIDYHSAFLSIYSLKHNYYTSYIYCGIANVVECDESLVINYKYDIQKYKDGKNYPAVTPINIDHYRKSFIEELREYADSGEDCHVYSFSTHALKEYKLPTGESTLHVFIEPRARDSIVIRNLCLKRGENSTSVETPTTSL